MNIFLIAAFAFVVLNVLAVQKNWQQLEYFTKPAVMIALFFWLWTAAGLNGILRWFGLAILCSLVGDVLLMISFERFFIGGLIAFLFAHIAYVIGFNMPLPALTAWAFLQAILIGWGSARVLRRITYSLAAQRQAQLRVPVIIYGLVISIMLLSALMKLNDLTWDANAALLVGAGAFLFYISDVILAWDKFVVPIQNGSLYNIIAYHLGQIALIAGVILQFKP